MPNPTLPDPVSYFATSSWTAGVIGLGYVGLPLLLTAAGAGLRGIGYDVSAPLVSQLNSARSHVEDISDSELKACLDSGVVEISNSQQSLAEADALFICVPSPLGRNRQPDLSYIERASETVESVVRPGQLVVLESTSYPGTTEDFIVPAIERSGLTLDIDVYVAFSPERVSPSDAMRLSEIPKVVGGVTELSSLVAESAYGRLVPAVRRVSSARAAEMTKLLENTYRAVNIGLINEMAQLAHELDIDIWEVVDAAATKPFGFQPFYPGPGVGGHCVPLDPQYLSWRAKEANFSTQFIDVAEKVNSKMPAYNARRIGDILNSAQLPVFGARVLGVGIAYKPNVGDDRESAALQVLDELASRGAIVSVLDPRVGEKRIREHGYEPVKAGETLENFDIAAVLTDHEGLDYPGIAQQIPLVYDSRGVYRRLGLSLPNVIAL